MESVRWEYKVLYVEATLWNKTGLPPQINEVLDELGQESWELVRAEPILGHGSTFAFVLFFKRMKL
jgi:hypothetical protein